MLILCNFTDPMTKLKLLVLLPLLLTQLCSRAQSYGLQYVMSVADSAQEGKAGLSRSFASRIDAAAYLAGLPALLQGRGYVTASIDSFRLDSTSGTVHLYLGGLYQWARLRLVSRDSLLAEKVRWNGEAFRGVMEFSGLQKMQQQILDHLEETGHPFGKAFLDSITLDGDAVSAALRVEEGPLYRIDSMRTFGEARISNDFLQRYLDLPNGAPYNRKKLEGISKKLRELSYLEEEKPSDLSLLGTGSVLNLYLKPRRISQVNALIGFLPNSDASGERSLLLTVDANLLFRNLLGNGETIGLVWQQLQKGSPRLNLLYEHPYIFRSPFGLQFTLDMYKRDSSFLNLNSNLGVSYRLNERQTGSLFVQLRQSIVSAVNTAAVLQTRQLPLEADVSSVNLGLGLGYNATDYRLNPKKGLEWALTATAGIKTLKKNNQILELKDPADPAFKFDRLYDTVQLKVYQFRVTAAVARYFSLGGQSTFKTALNAGLYQSANYFRNELFQIGGYKLLRGFDEESQFVSQYAVGTLEYRYLIGLNSAFFAFVDGGYGRHVREADQHHTYLGTGLGLSFETKAGIINLAWAVGRRNDGEFNLRQSKVHIGFASYF